MADPCLYKRLFELQPKKSNPEEGLGQVSVVAAKFRDHSPFTKLLGNKNFEICMQQRNVTEKAIPNNAKFHANSIVISLGVR